MLYHLTDITVKGSLNCHFCSIVIPLKIAFRYSTNIILIQYLKWKQKFEEPTKGKVVKCDWMSLFNTKKKSKLIEGFMNGKVFKSLAISELQLRFASCQYTKRYEL